MELTVFEGERQIGSLQVESDGLFYAITCNIAQSGEPIRRVFVGQKWRSEYLGIPDASGTLHARLPKKRLPDGIAFAVAARIPRGAWRPWRGEADGVPIAEALIKPSADGIDLLLPPREAAKLPAWAQYMQAETAFGEELMLLRLLPDGSLPKKNKDTGEKKDEENPCDGIDDSMSADDVSRDGVGDEGREADRADL